VELQSIEDRIDKGDWFDDVEFQIALQHAYLHLNTAWNSRHASQDEIAGLTQEDFDRWGRFPNDLRWCDE
jgi:hypothetical protein